MPGGERSDSTRRYNDDNLIIRGDLRSAQSAWFEFTYP